MIVFLLNGPDVAVGVWTSANRDNAMEMLCLALGVELTKRLLFVWGNEMCHSDKGRAGAEAWATVKRLDLVFKAYPQFGERRTIMVDDSVSKTRHNSANTVVFPTWDLMDPTASPIDDKVLRKFPGYLECIMHADTSGDVRDVLRRCPFSMPQPAPAATGQQRRHEEQVRYVLRPTWNVALPPLPPPTATTTTGGTTAAPTPAPAQEGRPVSAAPIAPPPAPVLPLPVAPPAPVHARVARTPTVIGLPQRPPPPPRAVVPPPPRAVVPLPSRPLYRDPATGTPYLHPDGLLAALRPPRPAQHRHHPLARPRLPSDSTDLSTSTLRPPL
ncbi:hypothetical protein H9P43_003013 [Blastocladiella emersonii ATCC 22665]|nr:hypothetical protein H9P43_003013 [Blastocladiella emersonii ATCC 22665]